MVRSAANLQSLSSIERADSPVQVTKPKIREEFGKTTVSFLVKVGTETKEILFRTDHLPCLDYTNVALATVLLPAMKLNSSIEPEGAISGKLLEGISKIQEIFHTWDKSFNLIKVTPSHVASAEERSSRGVACFFSGGVDSFYTLLKNIDEITHIILIHGFDFQPDFQGKEEVVHNITKTASKLGKNLIQVETNLHDFADKYVLWDFYHGSALASVSLLLSGLFEKIFIPSSHSYRWLGPWGSHPLVDPLWSTDELKLIHDGCEATRVKKVIAIAKNDVAMSYLRVCWENRDNAYNCGKCEKCLRTMINLLTVGALKKCKTFTRNLDLGRVGRIQINCESTHDFVQENLEAVKQARIEGELASALQDSLDGLYYKGVLGWPRRAWNLGKRRIARPLLSVIKKIFSSRKSLSQIAKRVRCDNLTYLSDRKMLNLEKCIKQIKRKNISGIFLETGIALGGSAIIIASHLPRNCFFRGYDTFGMIPPPSDSDDFKSHQRYQKIKDGNSEGINGDMYYGYRQNLYEEVVKQFSKYGLLVDQNRVSLHKGFFEKTLHFANGENVVLAHIDCDWYESVRLCLERIYPVLSVGGYFIIDDYHDYGGCRKAVDEFISKQSDLKIVEKEPNLVIERTKISI